MFNIVSKYVYTVQSWKSVGLVGALTSWLAEMYVAELQSPGPDLHENIVIQQHKKTTKLFSDFTGPISLPFYGRVHTVTPSAVNLFKAGQWITMGEHTMGPGGAVEKLIMAPYTKDAKSTLSSLAWHVRVIRKGGEPQEPTLKVERILKKYMDTDIQLLRLVPNNELCQETAVKGTFIELTRLALPEETEAAQALVDKKRTQEEAPKDKTLKAQKMAHPHMFK